MAKLPNQKIIELVKEITVAKVSASDVPANNNSGKNTALFMQEIYNQICKLNNVSED